MEEHNPPWKAVVKAGPIRYRVDGNALTLVFSEPIRAPEALFIRDLGNGLIQVMVDITGVIPADNTLTPL